MVGFATCPSPPGNIVCLQIYRTLLALTHYRSVGFRASILWEVTGMPLRSAIRFLNDKAYTVLPELSTHTTLAPRLQL